MAQTETLRIPIGLDTKEVQSDAKNIAKAVEGAFNSSAMKEQNKEIQNIASSMKRAYQQVVELSKAIDAVNNNPIKTDEYIEIEKQIERDSIALTKLSNKMWEFKEWGGDTTSTAFHKMEVQADELRNSIEYAQAELKELVDSGEGFRIDTDKVDELEKKLDVANDKLKIQYGNWEDIVKKQEESNDEGEELPENIEKANEEAEKLPKHIKKASKESEGLGFSFKKLAKTMFGVILGAQGLVAVLRKAVAAAKEGITNLAKEDVQMQGMMNLLNAKVTQLKNSLGAMAAPLIQKVIPVITKVIDMLTQAFNMVAKLVGKLMGSKKVTLAKTLGMDEGTALQQQGSGNSKKTPEQKYEEAVTKAQAKYEKELAKYQEKVAKNEEKQAKAAAKLAKQQEKANKQLGGFDELNVLTSNSIEDTLNSYEDLSDEMPQLELPNQEDFGSSVQMFEDVEVDEELPVWLLRILELLKSLKDRALELFGIFKKGFFDGLGKDFQEKIQNIIDNIKRIGEVLKEIWTDPEVVAAIQEWVNSVVYLVGSIIGAVASILATIGELVTGGIAKYLEENEPRITGFLENFFTIWTDINGLLATISQDIAEIFSVFGGEEAQQTLANIIAIFVNPLMFVIELVSQLADDILHVLWDPIHEHKEEIKQMLEDVMGWLSDLTELIKDVVNTVIDVLKKLYEEHIKPMWDDIKKILNDVWDAVIAVWNDTLKPVIDDVIQGLQEIWEVAKPVVEDLGETVGQVIDTVMDVVMALWEFLKPVFAWIHEHIGPILVTALKGIWNTVKNLVINVINTLKPLLDFIKNIFKLISDLVHGDFKAAFQDVKNIINNVLTFFYNLFNTFWSFIKDILEAAKETFRTPLNAILGFVETAVNGIIRGINKAIGALNNLRIDIPHWVPIIGGGVLEFNISELSEISLPRLAKGAVIPPSMQEYLAVLGDNNRETEVVSPLSTMKQAMIEALNEGNFGGGDGDIVIQIDGTEVFRAVRKRSQIFYNQTGISAFA